MRCFNHPAREAVAIFTACDKAICPQYKLESENGFACQQSCAKILSEKKRPACQIGAPVKHRKTNEFSERFFLHRHGHPSYIFSLREFRLLYVLVFLLGAGFVVYGVITQFLNMILFFKSKKLQIYLEVNMETLTS